MSVKDYNKMKELWKNKDQTGYSASSNFKLLKIIIIIIVNLILNIFYLK